MNRPALRAAALSVLCGLVLLLGAGPASAHTRLQSSDPADGTSVPTAPARVSLTFNEDMQVGFSTVTLIGPDGAAYQTGDVAADGGTVSTALLPLGPAGRYEIGYRVVSEDGHPVTGSVAFTLTAPGPAAAVAVPTTAAAPSSGPATSSADPAPAAASAPAAPEGGGAPVWPWIVGAVVLVAVGVVVALRLGRA